MDTIYFPEIKIQYSSTVLKTAEEEKIERLLNENNFSILIEEVALTKNEFITFKKFVIKPGTEIKNICTTNKKTVYKLNDFIQNIETIKEYFNNLYKLYNDQQQKPLPP